jgi:hypothetical protein
MQAKDRFAISKTETGFARAKLFGGQKPRPAVATLASSG